MYAGILALKPSTSSAAFTNGDLVMAGALGALQALHPGTAGYVLTSNGPGVPVTYQTPYANFLISAPVLATNSLGAPIAATAHQVVTPIECVDTSSSSSAYTCAPTPAVSSLSSGDTFILSGINRNNAAGTVTLKIGTATAATVSKWQNSGTTLAAGDLQGGATARLTYDGTYLELDTIGNPPAGITYTGASPIVVAGGAISCPTCGTTTAAPYVAQYTYVVYSATSLASITSPAITTVAGDLVTVECQVATGAGITVGISDSKANSWTTYSQINTTSPSMVMGWSVLTTGGSTTFTCTPNSSQGNQAMVVLDIKNASTATVVGHAATTTNSSISNLFNNFAIAPSGRSADVWCGAMNGSTAFYLGYIGGVPAQIAGVAASAIGTGAYDTCIFAVVPQATGQLPFYATWSSGNELTSAMIGFNY
jgi:hypothetical protein